MKSLIESQEKEAEIKRSILFALLASIIVSLSAGLIFSRSIAGRLRKVVSNIKSMEKPDLELIPLGGGDEIAALNLAIIDTNKRIRIAEQFQARTARIVAQELERPLDQIRELITDVRHNGFDQINSAGEERVDRSLLEIQRLRSLVTDLVSLDKISELGWDLKCESLNLAEIARNAVDTVQDYANSVGVELVLQTDEVLVIGDAARLQQVALNLLTNAIKFSRPKSKIEIETKLKNKFGKFSVTDHGTGIPEEFQQSIFGHFEQASRSDATEKGGSGLGLAVSKRLVESQEGRMGFRSTLGVGSTFWFSLPTEDGKGQNQQTNKLVLHPDGGDIGRGLESNKFKPTLRRNGLAVVLMPLAVQLVTICILWNVIGSIRANVSEFNRLSQITNSHALMMDALARATLFSTLYNIEPSDLLRKLVARERQTAIDRVAKLREVTHSNDELAKNIDSLDKMVHEQIAAQNEFMNARQNADLNQFFGPKAIEETKRKVAQLVIPLDQALASEEKLVDKNTLASTEMRESVGTVVLASAICGFLLAALLGIYMMRHLTLRVRRIVDNTELLAARKSLPTPSAENDEIAFVEHSFFQSANRLMQLEQFKQQLIALTSHEFRTPLTSLLAKADLMEAGVFGPLNEHGQRVVIKVKRSIADLISLLTNLLDVEKIQSGRTLVAKEDTSIDTILETSVQNVSTSAAEKEIEMTVKKSELKIAADSTRLIQALTAILSDIVVHAPDKCTVKLESLKTYDGADIKIHAPGGQCSAAALNTDSARGRLAVDLLRLIAQQHSGQMDVYAGPEQLLVQLKLPAA